MACTHGLSPRDCHHSECSALTTAMAESDPSTLGSGSSEESDISEEDSAEGESSSDDVEVVVDDMRSTNLGGSSQNPASNQGM